MRIATVVAALAATLLVARIASAEDEAEAKGTTTAADAGSAKEPRGTLGEKKYKHRINTVARKPLRHDVPMLESTDRTGWNGHETWQGIRDERPLIARKTLGFHDPRPHRTRMERVMILSRGPIRGPGFDE